MSKQFETERRVVEAEVSIPVFVNDEAFAESVADMLNGQLSADIACESVTVMDPTGRAEVEE